MFYKKILLLILLVISIGCQYKTYLKKQYPALRSHVDIITNESMSFMKSSGSGVVVRYNDQSCILTARHVIVNVHANPQIYAYQVRLKSVYGFDKIGRYQVIKQDVNQDLILIKFDKKINMDQCQIYDKKVYHGQNIYHIGNISSQESILTSGVISKPVVKYPKSSWSYVDCLIYMGSSGGGVFSSQDDSLVGIVSMMNIETKMGIICSNESVKKFLEK